VIYYMRVCVCAFMVNEAHLKGMKMQKIVRLMMVLAVLGLVAACATETSTKPQEQTAPTAQTAPAPEAPAAKPSGSTEADFIRAGIEAELRMRELEKKLTPDEKRRNYDIRKAVLDVAVTDYTGANKELPEWVRAAYDAYETEDYTKGHVAFQRSFGWGTGTFQGKPFYWFAFTNTDAWMQFGFSVKLDGNTKKVALSRKDGFGHEWEVELNSDPTKGYGVPAATWMGVTNDWIERDCTKPRGEACDIGSALDRAVAEMNSALGLKMTVKGKFPWEPLLIPYVEK